MNEQEIKFRLLVIPRAIELMFTGFAVVLLPIAIVMFIADQKHFWSKAIIVPFILAVSAVVRLFFLSGKSASLVLAGTQLKFHIVEKDPWELNVTELTGYEFKNSPGGDRTITLFKGIEEFEIPVKIADENKFLTTLQALNPKLTNTNPLTEHYDSSKEFSGKRFATMLAIGFVVMIVIIWLAIWSENRLN